MRKYIIKIISTTLMVSIFVSIFSISGSTITLSTTNTLPISNTVATDQVATIKPLFVKLDRSVGIEIAEEKRLVAEEATRIEAERLAAEEAARVEAERIAAEQEAARVAAEKAAAEKAAADKAAADKKAADKKAADKAVAETKSPSYNGSTGEQIVAAAKSKIGTPYGSGAGKFDCSGFTSWCYKQVGISLSPSSGVQAQNAARSGRLTRDQLQPGDLVFWSNSYGQNKGNFEGIGHVGIYVGHNMVIDASSDDMRVIERPLYSSDRPGASKFAFGARPY